VSKSCQKEITFILTKDEVLACAKELGMPTEQVTDEVIELVKSRLNREFRHWPEIIKDVLTQATKCPLGLVCFPSCFWWKEGKCTFPREA
jgi:hypothetical protein